MPNSLRRSQLIRPFGIGSVHMQPNGYSLTTAGLDDWYVDRNGTKLPKVQIERMKIIEPRLATSLQVDHFRLPPSDGDVFEEGQPLPSVPVFRFPTWFTCGCRKLIQGDPRQTTSPKCPKCDQEKQRAKRKPQTRFVAVCDHGHLQDFPWMEWVHKSRTWDADCEGRLEISASGGATLADIKVKCTKCGKARSLAGITSGDLPNAQDHIGKSKLSDDMLESGEPFLCQGICAWHGPDHPAQGCARPLRGILFNATNLHYSLTATSIQIPDEMRITRKSINELVAGDADLRGALKSGLKFYESASELVSHILDDDSDGVLKAFSAGELEAYALAKLAGEEPPGVPELSDLSHEEFHVFSESRTLRGSDLVMTQQNLSGDFPNLKRFCDSVVAIEQLKETIAFTGLSRVLGYPLNLDQERLLWKNPPVKESEKWLPAVQQTGEGIFLKFDVDHLNRWQNQQSVADHFSTLLRNHRASLLRRGEDLVKVKSPAYILIHTFSHLLINRLIFECGYGSSSLKERIYLDLSNDKKIAGLLIYTASGDSEGSLGGLVRLSNPETLERLIQNAIAEAQWCSSDPVCKESVKSGSGPDSLNYAACHTCALLPETCCESFNSLLDRTVFIRGLDQCFT